MQINTEHKILEAAREIFMQKGFAGARMQEIADKAQINKAMLHYYFKTKRTLFSAIVTDNINLLAPKLSAAFFGEQSVYDKLCKLVDIYIDTILKHPDIPMFLLYEMSQGHKDSIAKMKRIIDDNHSLAGLLEQIRREQEQQILKPVPPYHLVLSVMSLIVFPFVARPIFETMLEIPPEHYARMMQERKTIVKEIIKSSFVN